jgi:hypothetical protein
MSLGQWAEDQLTRVSGRQDFYSVISLVHHSHCFYTKGKFDTLFLPGEIFSGAFTVILIQCLSSLPNSRRAWVPGCQPSSRLQGPEPGSPGARLWFAA